MLNRLLDFMPRIGILTKEFRRKRKRTTIKKRETKAKSRWKGKKHGHGIKEKQYRGTKPQKEKGK
jgi:hypothetical protein